MAFDLSSHHLPLRTGKYETRARQKAEIFAVRANFEGREIGIGCTYDRSGAVMNVCEWDVITGKYWMHGGESPSDLVASHA